MFTDSSDVMLNTLDNTDSPRYRIAKGTNNTFLDRDRSWYSGSKPTKRSGSRMKLKNIKDGKEEKGSTRLRSRSGSKRKSNGKLRGHSRTPKPKSVSRTLKVKQNQQTRVRSQSARDVHNSRSSAQSQHSSELRIPGRRHKRRNSGISMLHFLCLKELNHFAIFSVI